MKQFIKFIFRELAPHKKTVIFCGVLAVLAAGLETAAPIIMGRGFDLAKQGTAFAVYGGALTLWFVIRFIAERLRTYIGGKGMYIGNMVSENFNIKAMEKILDKPLSFHYGEKNNENITKLSYFRWDIQSIIEGVIFDFVPAILIVMAILGYLFFIEWRIGLALALGMALFIFYTFKTSENWIKKRNLLNQAERDVDQAGWDGLRNILVVKSTSNENYFRKALKRLQDKFKIAFLKFIKIDYSQMYWQNAIIAVSSFAALLIGTVDFTSNVFSFGQLSAITAYTFTIFGYVRFVQFQIKNFSRGMTRYNVIKKVLSEPAEDFQSGQMVELKGDVEFANVAFGYQKDRQILKDVSFAVKSGERIAIVGESGEGKTTLVDLLGRYYRTNTGKILLDGIDLGKINLKSLRSQMAYVPQDLTLFHDTLEFNIHYGRPEASDKEVREVAEQAHLTDFIEKLPKKWKTVVGERGLKLSGGERQRVAIARAFLRTPKILVLDEPTAHLDSATEENIRQSLEKLMRDKTTFIIAHRLRTVKDADKILVLKDGRIAESGRHNDLIKNPHSVYRALLEAQGGFISPTEEHI